MAANVSPPPAMLKAELAPIAMANVLVPFSNAANSNTPTGPFHTMVPAAFSCSANMAAVAGPMSRIRSSSATSLAFLTVATASAAKVLATTTSTGMGTAAPRLAMAAITALASSTKSGSAKLLPIDRPAASIKVLAMPPPTIRPSTLPDRASRMVSLVDTLLPATIATKGLLGANRALAIASISLASKGPAHATGAYSAMP